jgi:hypothetical protein
MCQCATQRHYYLFPWGYIIRENQKGRHKIRAAAPSSGLDVRSTHFHRSVYMSSTNPPPELQSLFDAALNEFDKRAGTKLLQHRLIDSFAHCECADSIMDVLQAEAKAFRTFRGDGCKLMMWLKRTVHVLHAISNSGVLCEGIGLVRVTCTMLATVRLTFFFFFLISISKSSSLESAYFFRCVL